LMVSMVSRQCSAVGFVNHRHRHCHGGGDANIRLGPVINEVPESQIARQPELQAWLVEPSKTLFILNIQ
jgi:hypothetical protein